MYHEEKKLEKEEKSSDLLKETSLMFKTKFIPRKREQKTILL